MLHLRNWRVFINKELESKINLEALKLIEVSFNQGIELIKLDNCKEKIDDVREQEWKELESKAKEFIVKKWSFNNYKVYNALKDFT